MPAACIGIVKHLTCFLCRVFHGCLFSSPSVRTSRMFEFAAMPHTTRSSDRAARPRNRPRFYGQDTDGAQQGDNKKKKKGGIAKKKKKQGGSTLAAVKPDDDDGVNEPDAIADHQQPAKKTKKKSIKKKKQPTQAAADQGDDDTANESDDLDPEAATQDGVKTPKKKARKRDKKTETEKKDLPRNGDKRGKKEMVPRQALATWG